MLRFIESLATGRRVLYLCLLNLALTAGFALCAARFEAPRGPNVVDLELSFSPGVFKQILQIWAVAHPTGVQVFWWSVALLDTLFPPAYAALISALYTWVVRTAGIRPLRVGQLAPWLAAGLDWVENVLLLVLLLHVHDGGDIANTTFPAIDVAMMSTAAVLKLSLLAVTVALTLVTLFVGPRGQVLALCRFSCLSLVLGSVPLLALPQGRDLLLTLADGNASGLLARVGFLVFLVVWSMSVWYWARVLLMVHTGNEPDPTPDELVFATWTPRILGTATLALAGAAFVRAASIAEQDSGVPATMLLLGAVCGILAVAFCFVVIRRRAWMARMGRRPDPVGTRYDVARLPVGTRAVLLVSLGVSLVFFVLFVWWPVSVPSELGAITVLLIAAANTVFFGSLAVLLGRWLRVPVVAVGLLAAAVFSGWNDNHEVRRTGASGVTARPTLADAFGAWFAPLQACGGCAEVPVYLVAAEGGGIRAAYWTAGVLTHLQDQRPDFARHIFAISGVSGGSVGAGIFASLVKDSAGGRNRLPCSKPLSTGWALQPCAQEILARHFLAPTLAKMVSGDIAQWFLPLPVRSFDRGTALEESWARAYAAETGHDTLDEPYLGSFSLEGGQPALLLNGTHVQTGRRIIATPFSFTAAEIPDAYDLLEVLGGDLRLATAMHNSARFSYISPAGHLRTPFGEDRGHVVDGGYFENSGAATLQDLLHALRGVGVAAGPRPRFVVIYLCNSPDRCYRPEIDVAGEAEWRRPASMAEWFAPLRALLGAREARGSVALAELRKDVGREAFVELGVCRRLESQERSAPLPLGWQLSAGVRAEMDRHVQDPVCGAAPVP